MGFNFNYEKAVYVLPLSYPEILVLIRSTSERCKEVNLGATQWV